MTNTTLTADLGTPFDMTDDTRLVPVRRALLSVSDKTGLIDLARALDERGVELLSTGGSAKAIRDAGLPVGAVKLIFNAPEDAAEAVRALVEAPALRHVIATGSTAPSGGLQAEP